MNKLLGFYELKDSVLPTIPWREYNSDTVFDSNILWTVRTAVHKGDDLNLPRCVGVDSNEAKKFSDKILSQFRDNIMIIYYPYFLAEKSGTLNVFYDKAVIEAVKDDLWNLVTFSNKDVTIMCNENDIEYIGNKYFINDNELNELTSYIKTIKRMFRDDLLEGKSVLLEWSYAYKSDVNKNKMGDRYLVFYEARTV